MKKQQLGTGKGATHNPYRSSFNKNQFLIADILLPVCFTISGASFAFISQL
jgi:hypothetical protein